MSVISRYRWRFSIAMIGTLLALTLSLTFAHASLTGARAAGGPLTQISSDPFANPDSQHKTEVEPDTFAFGNTIVSAFQQGRFFNGGASDIGFATSIDGGDTWTHGSLPGVTVNSNPAGKYVRASDPSVAYDARHKVWIISSLGIVDPVNGPVDVIVSRSTDGGLAWGNPVVVNASGNFNDNNWSVCDDTSGSPHFGNCYTEYDDNT